jgi:hypothetical protein
MEEELPKRETNLRFEIIMQMMASFARIFFFF